MNNSEAPAAQPIMPQGKYRGRPLSTIPGEYLRWLIGETAAVNELKSNCRAELRRRRERITEGGSHEVSST